MKEKWSLKLILLGVGAVLALILGFVLGHFGALGYAMALIILAGLILGYFIFRNPFTGFLLIIFFLPFERVPTISFSGVDIKINTILGLITITAWLLASMFNGKKWKIQPNGLAWPISLFFIALLLSLTQALNFTRGVEVLLFSVFTIILSLMTVNMIPDKTTLEKSIIVLFSSSVFVGLFGLFQFGGNVIGLPDSITLLKYGYGAMTFGFPRIQAFSMEPLYFANYLLIPLSLAFAYFFSHVNFVKRWWLIGIMVLLLINFVLTVSRGGYLGLIATLLVFIIFYFRRVFTRRNVIILFVFLAVAGGVYYGLAKSQSRALKSFTNQATGQDAKVGSESIQGRLSAYSTAYNIFKWHEVFGIGLGNYGPYVANYPSNTPKSGWQIVNNEFIEILAETGLVGTITYGLILLVIAWRSIMAIRLAKDQFLKATMFGLFAAFIGVMVQYNFFSTLYIIHIWVLIGLLIAVQNLIFREAKA